MFQVVGIDFFTIERRQQISFEGPMFIILEIGFKAGNALQYEVFVNYGLYASLIEFHAWSLQIL